ncbi:hypothetical protein ACFL5B_02315, partial [Candidatus Latescibacterota bacterium]
EESSLAEIDDEETAVQSFEEGITEDYSDYTEMTVDEKSDEPTVGPGSGDQPKAINVLEIEEEEEYDPSTFDRETSASEGEEPVISKEERAELLAYDTMTEKPESETMEETAPATESETHEELEEAMEVEQETVEDKESKINAETGEFFSELTREEADVLSVSGTEEMEDDRDLELETKEGIDYSDVLSEKTLTPEIEESDEIDLTEMEEVIEEKDEIPAGREIEVEDFVPDESGVESLDEMEDISETETAPTDTSDESLRIVEELIKSSSDIEVPTMDEEKVDVENLSLGELISDYENSLKEEPSISPDKESTFPQEDDYESLPDADSSTVAREETTESFPDESTLPEENITATMAEIYVSQGMISHAIAIYNALLKKEPENEKVISRLEELTELQDQQSSGS